MGSRLHIELVPPRNEIQGTHLALGAVDVGKRTSLVETGTFLYNNVPCTSSLTTASEVPRWFLATHSYFPLSWYVTLRIINSPLGVN